MGAVDWPTARGNRGSRKDADTDRMKHQTSFTAVTCEQGIRYEQSDLEDIGSLTKQKMMRLFPQSLEIVESVTLMRQDIKPLSSVETFTQCLTCSVIIRTDNDCSCGVRQRKHVFYIDPLDGEIVDSTAKLKRVNRVNREFTVRGTKFFKHGSLLIEELPEFAKTPDVFRETSAGKFDRRNVEANIGADSKVQNFANTPTLPGARLKFTK